MISLPIENHKIFLKSYPNSFLAEDAISNLGGLQFIQTNHDADPRDPTRIITRVVTTQFSLSRDMAKNLCQTFMDARLFESASDPSKREFQNKGVYQVTGKGGHIIEKFVRRNGLSIEDTRHITANATPRILILERAEDEDAIVLNQKSVDTIFKRFAGSRPNVMSDSSGEPSTLTSSSSRDRMQASINRCNGIEVKDQQHNYDIYKHTFNGKAAVDWILDYTTVISKEEAICIAQEMVSAQYIEQVGDESRNGHPLFKAGNSALYHFTELGRAVLGWESLIHNRGSSVNGSWMDGRRHTGIKLGRSGPELLLSTQFKLTSNNVSRLPISVMQEKRRSADEHSLGSSTRYSDDATTTNGSLYRLSQLINDPASQLLADTVSSYAPSSSSKDSLSQREGISTNGGSSTTALGSSAQSTTSNTTRLNLILSNLTLREMFKGFLKQSLCEENLSFYMEVLDYKDKFNTLINSSQAYLHPGSEEVGAGRSAPEGAASLTGAGGLILDALHPLSLRELEKQICTQAFAIHETYLVSGAPRELNLPHQMRQDITAYMQAVVRNMNAHPLPASTAPSPSGNHRSPPNSSSPYTSSAAHDQHNSDNESRGNSAPQRELIHISLFDRIHDHIFRLMSTDSVPKFTKTDKYREAMMNRVRQKDNMSNGSSHSIVNAIGTMSISTNGFNGAKPPSVGTPRLERTERGATPSA
ncbi:hypothetical protein BX616_010700 [Lobosporangium transversale]|nr:hypothetical protein BX616_010700 [Lobosporangium transversale]